MKAIAPDSNCARCNLARTVNLWVSSSLLKKKDFGFVSPSTLWSCCINVSSVRYLSLDDYSFCYCNRGAQLQIISPQILPPWRLQMDLWSYRNTPLHSIDICCRLFQMKISEADTPTVMYTSNKSHHLDWWHCISQTARIACWQLGPRGIEHAMIGDNFPRSKTRPRIRNDADEV